MDDDRTMTMRRLLILIVAGALLWAVGINCAVQVLADEPLDEWRAHADIGDPVIHHLFDVAPCPGTLACTTVAISSDGEFEGWVIIGTDEDYWIYVHEYGHALGLALDGHTTGVMGPYGGTEIDLSNVAEIQELYPAYPFRLVVSY